MKSKPPNVAKPLPIKQSFTSLAEAFQQALALELMLAQRKLAKDRRQVQATQQPLSNS